MKLDLDTLLVVIVKCHIELKFSTIALARTPTLHRRRYINSFFEWIGTLMNHVNCMSHACHMSRVLYAACSKQNITALRIYTNISQPKTTITKLNYLTCSYKCTIMWITCSMKRILWVLRVLYMWNIHLRAIFYIVYYLERHRIVTNKRIFVYTHHCCLI